MIVILHNRAHAYTHQRLENRGAMPPISSRSWEWALNRKRLPRATYVFTDRERMDPWQVRVLGALYRHINSLGPGWRAINDPARMLPRAALLRRLHVEGVNPFNAYSLGECAWPQRYPVFIRRAFDHGQPLGDLIHDEVALRAQLERLRAAGEPEEGLLLVEYCAEPAVPGLFRKLSAYRIADTVFFYNAVHQADWLVKYGTLNAASDELYREEQTMIAGNAYEPEVRRVFDLAGIDYGRADFSLVDGKPVFYEINTNPMIRPPQPHPNDTRAENMQLGWERYGQAMHAIDTNINRAERAAGKATIFTHPDLQRGRSLRPGFTRARIRRA